MRSISRALIGIAVTVTILSGGTAQAYKIQIAEHTNLNVDYLLQVQTQFAEDKAPNGTDWSKDFFIRRSRILLFGDLWKNISFFMETEQANFGKGGDWSVSFFVQDAYMSFKVVDEFQVDVGMILLPFSRPNMQGAIGLNAMDYHSNLIKFPDGTHKVWRDAGVQIRGLVANKKLQYRVGVFNGSQGLVLQKDAAGKTVEYQKSEDKKAPILAGNPKDWPRFTGHVRYNILGVEPDFFPKGIYFAAEPILSVGMGVDFQKDIAMKTPADLDANGKDIAVAGMLANAVGVSADVFLDIPIKGDHEIVFQGAFYWYDQGNELKYVTERQPDGTDAVVRYVVPNRNSGFGVLSEVGYRWTFLEPVLSVDWFNSRQDAQDYLGVRGGLNFWIRKHAANVKAEFAAEKRGDLSKATWAKTVTAQAQLFF